MYMYGQGSSGAWKAQRVRVNFWAARGVCRCSSARATKQWLELRGHTVERDPKAFNDLSFVFICESEIQECELMRISYESRLGPFRLQGRKVGLVEPNCWKFWTRAQGVLVMACGCRVVVQCCNHWSSWWEFGDLYDLHMQDNVCFFGQFCVFFCLDIPSILKHWKLPGLQRSRYAADRRAGQVGPSETALKSLNRITSCDKDLRVLPWLFAGQSRYSQCDGIGK